MAEELAVAAALAYETYRTAHAGTVAGGLPMPVWEHLSVPERDAWLAVASAVTAPPEPPAGTVLWTQDDLEQLTVSDLRDLLTHEDLSAPSAATKQQLIDVLLASRRAATPLEG